VTVLHQSELILGGARSGKSRQALTRARQSLGPTVFLATAPHADASMGERIARHRAERPCDWTTVEEPLEIAAACRRLAGRYDLAIIDCLTLWVSNRLGRGEDDETILNAADELAAVMGERALSLILVSNEVGQSVHPLTDLGLRFQALLGSVNQRIAAAADSVTLMVAGLPLWIKGAPPAPTAAPPARDHDRAVEAP
jgi:adenosylcobinamide kinase / adenosylcobinamide-phosphate guanylyltransferase